MLKVQPKASKNEVAGFQSEYLKVKVVAPPVGGKANRECVKLLAERLGVKISRVRIERGKTSRLKKVKVTGSPTDLIDRFKKLN